ncbi:MAG: carbohydrate ABC transporter permease [Fimbriimonadaceae bacterium]
MKSKTGAHRSNPLGYLFIAPATLHLFLFALLPIGYAFYLSFFKWDLLKDETPFVGFGNYADALTDGAFWNAMWNSARYALVGVPLGMAVALAIALLVHQKLRGMAIFRTVYYIPAISSGVAIAMLWIYMYLPETGLINVTLGLFGLPKETDFLNSVGWAMWALVFMSVWTGLGPRMVLYLAGLLGIPPALYEAAELDGAGAWKTFWNVTLPMLAPTTFFVLVTSTISAFQVFTPVYMMTRGGPLDSTDVIGYHIYVEAWRKFHVGLASSKSFLLLLVMLGIAYWQFRAMKSQLEGYHAG